MEQLSYTGKDIGVCFLDTGIADHPDFKGRIQVFTDFIAGKKILMMIMDMVLM